MNPVIAASASSEHPGVELVGVSPPMREALSAARDVAPTPTTVLVLGESGTGKSELARHIHRCSGRGSCAWINCASAHASLEAELFGQGGQFERARGGTLVLDALCEMPLPVQARLLRALQERAVDRESIHAGPRIIATSQRDLSAMVRASAFRADLYYRINVFPIRLPPLRERSQDVPALAQALVVEAAAAMGMAAPRITDAALAALSRETFPGNVRELAGVLERSLVRHRGPVLDSLHLGLECLAPTAAIAEGATSYPPGLPLDLGALERLAIEEALRRVAGNRTHAARLLGIGLRTLRNKLRQWRQEQPAAQPIPSSEQAA